MTIARFPVMGRLDGAGGNRPGTVLIDRETGDFIVRPKRRHQTFSMPLSTVATMVCQACILSEMHIAKKAKKRGRP